MPRSSIVVLSLLSITLAFFLKGLVFVSLIPMHQGSDEYAHYATVQYHAEPVDKPWEKSQSSEKPSSSKEIGKYHYSDEIRAFALLTESIGFSGKPYDTQILSEDSVRDIEARFRNHEFLPYITVYPPDIVGQTILYHLISSRIEKALDTAPVFERYAAVRSIAIVYGIIAVLCAYFIALWSGLRREHALLLSGIVAFHPQFTATTAIINYDPLLIAATSVAIASAASILRHRLNFWNTLGILSATAAAFFTKGVGGVLFFFTAGVLFWGVRERVPWLKKQALWKLGIAAIVLFGIVFALSPKQYTSILTSIPAVNKEGDHLWPHVLDYLDDGVFDSGKFERTSDTYWGTFGWLDTTLHGSVMSALRFIQYVGFFGTLIFFLVSLGRTLSLPTKRVTQKVKAWTRGYFTEVRSYLPEAKYAWLFLFSIALLQAAIRFYDWYGRYTIGEGVGTPGRYFLPNIIPHFMLLVIGFGMLVKTEWAFGLILRILLVLMVFLNLYSVFWIIIPRYYL
jgi:4-amino-4-deoxy-L-arabinose transferase-like glycosyltransferase